MRSGRSKELHFEDYLKKHKFDALKYGRAAFGKTMPLVRGGPACRLYGSTIVKKVIGNLHVTMAGHGYFSAKNTDVQRAWNARAVLTADMNVSHVIHELSFGPYFPRIAEPLENTYEVSDNRMWTRRAH